VKPRRRPSNLTSTGDVEALTGIVIMLRPGRQLVQTLNRTKVVPHTVDITVNHLPKMRALHVGS